MAEEEAWNAIFSGVFTQELDAIPGALVQAVRNFIQSATFLALVSAMCGKNMQAIQILIQLQLIASDFVQDELAAYWIEYHLLDILVRMEHPIRLGFDVLAGFLLGFLALERQDAMNEQVENLQGLHSALGQLLPCISKMINQPESQAKVALFVGQAARLKNKMPCAIEWLQRSLDLACTNEIKLRAASQLGNCFINFDPAKAVEYYRLAKDAAFRTGVEDLKAISLLELGRSLCKLNNFGEAWTMEKQLTEMAESSDDLFVKACASKHSSLLAMAIGDFPTSASHNVRITTLLEGFPTNVEETQKSFLLGEAREQQASPLKINTAARMLLDAWDQIAQTDLVAAPRAFSEHEMLLARVPAGNADKAQFFKSACLFYYDTGLLEEAEAYAAELLAHADRASLLHSKAMALVFLAEIAAKYYQEKRSSKYSFEIIKTLLEEAEVLGRPNTVLRFRVLLRQGLNFSKVQKLDDAIQSFRKAARMQMELDNKFDSFNLGRVVYQNQHYRFLRLLQASLIHRGTQPDREEALVWADRERCRDLLYNLKNVALRDAYLREIWKFNTDDHAAWEELKDIARLAGDETMILVLTLVPEKSAVCTYLLNWNTQDCDVSFGSNTVIVSSGKEVENNFIHQKLARTRHDIKRGYPCGDLLELWYSCFIKPWEGPLEQYKPKRLLIIPQEELSTLPFAAFQEAEGEPYLIQKYAISVAPSLRMYKQCFLRQQQLRNLVMESQPSGLVIGNPSLSKEYRSLEFAEEEANLVKAALEDSGFRVNHLERLEATKEAAMSLFPSSNWVHIACHALINEQFPSGALLLASSDEDLSKSRREGPDSSEELEHRLRAAFKASSSAGILSGEDLENAAAAHPLEAMVVVLSACSSGLGAVYAEGIIGLTRSFHLLGVPTVVASLWNVDDESTGVLMKRLYGQLRAGLDVALALQKAIVSMIEETEEGEFGGPVYDRPYYWASFHTYGCDKASLLYTA